MDSYNLWNEALLRNTDRVGFESTGIFFDEVFKGGFGAKARSSPKTRTLLPGLRVCAKVLLFRAALPNAEIPRQWVVLSAGKSRFSKNESSARKTDQLMRIGELRPLSAKIGTLMEALKKLDVSCIVILPRQYRNIFRILRISFRSYGQYVFPFSSGSRYTPA